MKLENPPDAARFISTICLFSVLTIRCFFGLDITDEMQYLGQVLGLIESNRLFTTDLFIQQLIYIIFIPAFKLFHIFFGEVGFVFFGRLLLAILLTGLFIFVRNNLLELGSSRWQAALAAFSITFAIPYHGIFSLSYNTISQLAWVVFIFWYLSPLNISPWKWSFLILITGLSHPIAALSMISLLSISMWNQRQIISWITWLTPMIITATFSVILILQFTTWRELIESVNFSKGFGIGSGNILSVSNYEGKIYVILLATLALASNVFTARKYSYFFAFLTLSISALLIKTFFILINQWSLELYFSGVPFIALISFLSCLVAFGLRDFNRSSPNNIFKKIMIVSSVHFMVLISTSSNGLVQGMGSLLITIPIALALISTSISHENYLWKLIVKLPLVLFAVTMLAYWIVAPYRDLPWYKSEHGTSDIPAFRLLSIAQPHLALLNSYKEFFGSNFKNRKILVASSQPAIYFALGAKPETCMLFMHSTGDTTSANILRKCLNSREPEAILDISDNQLNDFTSPIRTIITEQVMRLDMTCEKGHLIEHWIYAPPDKKLTTYRLCTR